MGKVKKITGYNNWGVIKGIREITEDENYKYTSTDGRVFDNMIGYCVTTDKRKIHVLIDSVSKCCEQFGYLTTHDGTANFIGAELLKVKITDTALGTKYADLCDNDFSYKSGYVDVAGAQFVDFETSKGVFQLTVYNWHNGYYGHDIVVAIDGKVKFTDNI